MSDDEIKQEFKSCVETGGSAENGLLFLAKVAVAGHRLGFHAPGADLINIAVALFTTQLTKNGPYLNKKDTIAHLVHLTSKNYHYDPELTRKLTRAYETHMASNQVRREPIQEPILTSNTLITKKMKDLASQRIPSVNNMVCMENDSEKDYVEDFKEWEKGSNPFSDLISHFKAMQQINSYAAERNQQMEPERKERREEAVKRVNNLVTADDFDEDFKM